jgi:hypothetical protein
MDRTKQFYIFIIYKKNKYKIKKKQNNNNC